MTSKTAVPFLLFLSSSSFSLSLSPLSFSVSLAWDSISVRPRARLDTLSFLSRSARDPLRTYRRNSSSRSKRARSISEQESLSIRDSPAAIPPRVPDERRVDIADKIEKKRWQDDEANSDRVPFSWPLKIRDPLPR